MDEKKILAGFELLLSGIGLSNKEEQAKKISHFWAQELCLGLKEKWPGLETYPTNERKSLIMFHQLEINSLCEHHLLPFFGHATLGYVPTMGKLASLSSISRLVNNFSRRPALQENLTSAIQKQLEKEMGGFSGVFIQATHLCQKVRQNKSTNKLTTLAYTQKEDKETKQFQQEFLQLLRPFSQKE